MNAKEQYVVAGTTTYKVRDCEESGSANNTPRVSSQTGGKTHRVPGNLDASWQILLCVSSETSGIPVELEAGNIITLHTPREPTFSPEMIIDLSSEAGLVPDGLRLISLNCSASSEKSYRS